MGQLYDGRWTDQDVARQHDDTGLYFKQNSVFRDRIETAAGAKFPAEPGRYHLYCAIACPWAHRATLFRTLKKLEPIVTLTNTFHEPGGQGWSFGPDGHVVPGTSHRARFLHELYTIADPNCTTRVTVPTLWDASTCKVVNNESSEIIRIFNDAFHGIAPPTPDYYPEHLRAEIDETNAFVLKGVNNAVNGCGYSISQEAYDASIRVLFETLDSLEERLGRRRYLCGDVQTEADWRLYPSLVRFDACYYVGYKCNLRRLEDYRNLSNYLRELYQTPGIAGISDIAAMKRQVFSKTGPIGSNGIVPVGPVVDHTRPHDRTRFARAA
ncbi:MAG: glutathione S-transferase family protein [Hyphomicrobiaceae bacterium]